MPQYPTEIPQSFNEHTHSIPNKYGTTDINIPLSSIDQDHSREPNYSSVDGVIDQSSCRPPMGDPYYNRSVVVSSEQSMPSLIDNGDLGTRVVVSNGTNDTHTSTTSAAVPPPANRKLNCSERQVEFYCQSSSEVHVANSDASRYIGDNEGTHPPPEPHSNSSPSSSHALYDPHSRYHDQSDTAMSHTLTQHDPLPVGYNGVRFMKQHESQLSNSTSGDSNPTSISHPNQHDYHSQSPNSTKSPVTYPSHTNSNNPIIPTSPIHHYDDGNFKGNQTHDRWCSNNCHVNGSKDVSKDITHVDNCVTVLYFP